MNRWPPSKTREDFPFPKLVFSAKAWLKLNFLCHEGPTEVGGFAISSSKNLLAIQDVVTVRQEASPISVRFADDAVADFFDQYVDGGWPIQQVGRIWFHTHPGDCPLPSLTDEETFARVFSPCDWSVMFILSRSAASYARLHFGTGPSADLLLNVKVDWKGLPRWLGHASLEREVGEWREEYLRNVHLLPWPTSSSVPSLGEDLQPLLENQWDHFFPFLEEPVHDFESVR